MGVALYIVLERQVKNLDSFVDGKMLAKAEPDLNRRATELNVTPLMDFYGSDPDEIFEEFDLEALETAESLEEQWFEAKDGLQTVNALLKDLENRPNSLIFGRDITTEVVEDLKQFQRVLLEADNHKVRWHLAVDY
jgi:hypothetical protein